MTRIKIHSPVRYGVVVVALSSLVLAGCATSSNPAAEATKGKTITVWTTDTLPDVSRSVYLPVVRTLAANEFVDYNVDWAVIKYLGNDTFSKRALDMTQD